MQATNISIAQTTVTDWLGEIAYRTASETLAFDEHGHCAFKVGNWPIVLMYLASQEQRLALTTFVGEKINQTDSACVMETLLRWNHELEQLQGATIGLCHEQNKYSLTASFDIQSLDATLLYNTMQRFSELAELISEKIESMSRKTCTNKADNTLGFDQRSDSQPGQSKPFVFKA